MESILDLDNPLLMIKKVNYSFCSLSPSPFLLLDVCGGRGKKVNQKKNRKKT
jgi:hypothetical protein